jgi:hypothetical protein
MPTPREGYKVNGEKVPSVTTIIGRFKDSSMLMFWAFKQGKEGKASLYEERDKKGEIGTVAHKMIELNTTTGQKEFDCLCESSVCICSTSYKAFESYLKWAEGVKLEIITKYQEVPLVCPKYKFGGTPDALGLLDGSPVLLDWKTSNGVYVDYILQLAAYVHLVNNGINVLTGKSLGITLKPEAYLLRVNKTTPGFSYHYFGDLTLAWKQFKLLRRAYDYDLELKQHL